MTSFWLAASAMVIIALVLVLPAMLGRLPRNRFTRKQANVAIYREHLAELDAELAAGTIAASEYKEAQAELGQAMLDDVEANKARRVLHASASPWAGIIVGVATPLIAFGLYLQLGTPLGLHTDNASLHQQGEETSVEELVRRLENRLVTNPEDAEGWWMLARTYAAMDRLEAARGAYEKAYERLETNPDMLVDYAEVLARLNGNRFEGRPYELLRTALQRAPDSERILWLFGIAEFQQDGATKAIATWERLRELGTLGPEETALLDQFIARAKNEAPAASVNGARSEVSDADDSGADTITVRVDIANNIAERLAPTDTVFVFARAADGPRMPLAIVKTAVKDLPATLVLDDGDAMNSEFKLSNYSTVVVEARVSKSGNALRSSGDFEGLSQTVQPGTHKPIHISIREVVP
ncbi:MAG: c-type cytochrome biogenesis protein CcmI [Gammaproteobacteria bacterium]|jgi:cytochrome c-type biogenesis protein CcmH